MIKRFQEYEIINSLC